MNVGLWGWDEVDLPLVSQWRKIHVNAVGDVQVDVGSSALPLGAASAANQVLINANLATMVTEQGRCYGWVGDVWYHLLVESAANPNLRVRLYDGANAVTVRPHAFAVAAGDYGLVTASCLTALFGVAWHYLHAGQFNADNQSGGYYGLETRAHLYGYDGSQWDRLRTYDTGILKIGRAPIGATTLRVTAAGQVDDAGAKKLYWISCSPDAPGAEFELSDATEALQPVVFDHFDPDKHSEIINFDPPMEFANGIWVEKFDHIHSLVFCYE